MAWLISHTLMQDYANSRSLLELGAASLAAPSSAGEPSAPLNTTPMPPAYCSPDKMTDCSRLSRFGMKFAPLTDDLGVALLTWYRAGFRAKTYPQPAKGPASLENAADSGWKWRESSAKYDPDSSSWKTRQCSLFADLAPSSLTWPRWGLMRDGECWELPMSARPICARGFGLLPTIRASDGERGGRGDLIQAIRGNPNSHYRLWPTPRASEFNGRGGGTRMPGTGGRILSQEVKLWPTPIATDWKNGCGKTGNRPEASAAKAGLKLGEAVKLIPTPTARDWNSGKASEATHARNSRPLSEQIGGSLNPDWVELLMGWPKGWSSLGPLTGRMEPRESPPACLPERTASKPSVTARCHCALQRHGKY